MANHLRTELVLAALEMAIGQRRPGDVTHHSDRGRQHTSIAFGKRYQEAGMRPARWSPVSTDVEIGIQKPATLVCGEADGTRRRRLVDPSI